MKTGAFTPFVFQTRLNPIPDCGRRIEIMGRDEERGGEHCLTFPAPRSTAFAFPPGDALNPARAARDRRADGRFMPGEIIGSSKAAMTRQAATMAVTGSPVNKWKPRVYRIIIRQ